MKINSLLMAITLFGVTHANADFKGNVIAVRDGGSVIVNSNGQDILVKLNSIVTPYPNQSLYVQSRFVAERIFMGRNVNVITNNTPANGCVYGELISDGANLNEALLMSGYAWIFNKNTASERYINIQNQVEKMQRGIFSPDSHFQTNTISLTPSYFFRECLAASVKVPISEQYDFVAERDKFGFGYSIRSLIIGFLLGVSLLIFVFYIDRLGLDIDISKYFKRKKRDNDGFK
jgi:endonuclease YncB( thermonuclease family)